MATIQKLKDVEVPSLIGPNERRQGRGVEEVGTLQPSIDSHGVLDGSESEVSTIHVSGTINVEG